MKEFICSISGKKITNECVVLSGAFVTNTSFGSELAFTDDIKVALPEYLNAPSDKDVADLEEKVEKLEKEVERVRLLNDKLNDKLNEENASLELQLEEFTTTEAVVEVDPEDDEDVDGSPVEEAAVVNESVVESTPKKKK